MSACRTDTVGLGRANTRRDLLVKLALALGLAGCVDGPDFVVPRKILVATQGEVVHRLVHVPGVVAPSLRGRLGDGGIRLLGRRGGGWWLAVGPVRAFDSDPIDGIRVVAPTAKEKLSPRLRQMLSSGVSGEVELWVLLSPVQDGGRTWLEGAVGRPVQRVGFAPIHAVTVPVERVLEVATFDPVRWLDLPPAPAVPLLDESRVAIGVEQLHGIDSSTTPPTYELGGAGTVGGVWDPDGVEPTHGDLKDKLLRHTKISIPNSLYHGTAVSGCLAGSGARSSALPEHPWKPHQLRGMAPEAKLVTYLASNDVDDQGTPTTFLEQYLEARNIYGVDVLSFSFSHTLHAVYDSAGANLDFLIHRTNHSLPEPVPIAVASGNESYKFGYGSVTGLGSAKNVLTVGASDWADGKLVSFSSLGPTEDGRIKPEITAPGCANHGKTRFGLDRVRLLPKAGSGAKVVEWTFDTSVDGWTVVKDLTSPVVLSGVLDATTTGNDSGVKSPDKLGLDTSVYDTVEVSMRVDRHHRGELFWKTDKAGFSGKRRHRFFVNGDGQLHTYTLDLAGDKDWKDKLEQLRIDPVTTGIALTVPGDTYSTSCGTSMSTPIAAGAILLLVQAWRDGLPGEVRPSPAMLKALLTATARDMVGQGPGGNPNLNGAPTPYPAGPDFATGFGEIQVDRAVELIRQAAQGRRGFLEQEVAHTGRRVQVRLRLSQPSEPFNVTLVWDDPPGEPGAAVALQNDLDLKLTDPSGKELLPWLLDPAKPTTAAGFGTDRRNNLEQVPVAAPAAGDYVVTISGHELAQGPQRFALVVSDVGKLTDLTLDLDGDGAFADTDCDDTNAAVHPEATEVIGNGRDDDCDPGTPDRALPMDGGIDGKADAESDGGTDVEVGGGGGCSCEIGQADGAIGLIVLFLVFGLFLMKERGGGC